MNIGLFSDSYFPEVSGLATSIKMLQKELKKRGHNVYIFTTSNPNAKGKIPGVFRLPSMPFIFLKSRRVGLFYSPRAAQCVKHLKLDIIHTQTEFSLGIFAKIMARQMGIPVVHTYHTIYKDYVHYISKDRFNWISNDFVRFFSRNYCNGCNAIIAPTKKVYDLLSDYGVDKRVKVIPTGIELGRFRKEIYRKTEVMELKTSLGIKEEDPIILFIGRIAKEKSIDMVIRQMPRVLEHIPNAKFLIVGNGPSLEELKTLANELGLNKTVIFAGERPWEEIGRFYRLGDVFASASVTEAQGLTLIEAMASDVPVAARYDRNIDELIKDKENGRIYRTEDELVNILIEILTDKELSEKLVRNGRKTVEAYSAESFGASVEKLYYEVLEQESIKKKMSFKRLKPFRYFRIRKPRA